MGGERIGVREAFRWGVPTVAAALLLFAFLLSGCPNPIIGAIFCEINVKQGTTVIESGSGYDFSTVTIGSSLEVPFVIENTGTGNLLISSSPQVKITGTHQAQFVVGTQAASSISAGGKSDFTIVFSPTDAGVKTAALTIESNDLDEGTYTISLSGTGTTALQPEMNLKQGDLDIPSGGSYDFGSIVGGTSSPLVTFKIENLGAANLTLSGDPKVKPEGAHAVLFPVGPQPASPLVPGANTTFGMVFSPDSLGDKTATVTIPNNDPNENPYTFTVRGTGIPTPQPEINVKQGSTDIPSGTGSYQFGYVAVGYSSPVDFTVWNIGAVNTVLIVEGILITGVDFAEYSVPVAPSSDPLGRNQSTTFTVSFNPTSGTADGLSKQARVSLDNTDNDEDPYTFDIVGIGFEPGKWDESGCNWDSVWRWGP